MASASTIMDKPRRQQQQQQQSGSGSGSGSAAALKCPRCDSSDTKFCYYNNYSLSQPRHFCKACKRYWTRGGTLRNVPVGGGCRKNNKRLKTTSSSSVNGTAATSTPSQNPRLLNAMINNISSSHSASNHDINNPMFFGVHHNTNPSSSALNLHFSNLDSFSAPQLDAIGAGLGFSSSGLLSHVGDISNQFHHPAISFDRNSQLLGNFETSWTTPRKEVIKMEGSNRLRQNQTEQMDLSNFSDPSHYWNSSSTTATGNWHDPTNNGSSIASLF